MPSHAQLSGRLLRDAAGFFRTVGEQNETLRPQMEENANVFEQVSSLVEQDPNGKLPEQDNSEGAAPAPTHAQLSARLLRDAAGFFRTVGEQNEELKPQMEENANVFEQVSSLVEQDPEGEVQEEGGETPPPAA